MILAFTVLPSPLPFRRPVTSENVAKSREHNRVLYAQLILSFFFIYFIFLLRLYFLLYLIIIIIIIIIYVRFLNLIIFDALMPFLTRQYSP